VSKDFHGFSPRPNLTGYTALPNEFFDEVLPNITSMSELKILLAVFRKTYGWVKAIDQNTGQPIYKLEDEISYSQFELLTGLSSTSIANGLDRAIKDKYLEKTQQGNYSGTTSAYRVVTTDGSKPEPPKPQEPQKDKQTRQQQQTANFKEMYGEKEKSFKPEPLKGFEPETTVRGGRSSKQDLINDILGTPLLPEPEKEKKQTAPHAQFIKKWVGNYYSLFNTKYSSITGKEHGHIKHMLKDYDIDTLIKAMDFYFTNYKVMDGVPNDYPSIAIFFGFRHKIIPASIHGLIKPQPKKDRTGREFNEDKWKEDDFFDN
jgi:hypothetical protein